MQSIAQKYTFQSSQRPDKTGHAPSKDDALENILAVVPDNDIKLQVMCVPNPTHARQAHTIGGGVLDLDGADRLDQIHASLLDGALVVNVEEKVRIFGFVVQAVVGGLGPEQQKAHLVAR
jgi:hypothetical protein